MKIKTVTTAAGVNDIYFDGYAPKYYWIKNLSDTTLYVSANSNPVVGADNVSELPAKASTAIETDEGVIYILGAGKVEIHNTDSKLCPFETPGIGSGEVGAPGQDGKSAYEIAVGNGFTGTEEEWLESLKGEKGDKGEDGRSIISIITDTNNNVIATFSDGMTQNIGQLDINVHADFLTSNGFGNLRYYNGHFQYYNGTNWIDTSVTPDNVYVMNMIPQPMQFINGTFDTNLSKYKLKWLEPSDTIIDGQVTCVVEKVIIRRKLGSVPADENDGTLVLEVQRRDFGSHKDNYFVDNELTSNAGDIYYYKAFPVSTTGFCNVSSLNETKGIVCREYSLYGFKIDQNESDPANMITYIEDNTDYLSAHMDYNTDSFNYGDWADAFFMQVKPCMLKYDGTVDYYLNPNDYSVKEDGTPSDIADTNYGGNVMIQFPKVYLKIVDNGDNTANIYISDKKLDNDFHCWSHIDPNGNEIDYCYMPAYNGYSDGTRLRSLSGRKLPIHDKTALQEISLACANNLANDTIWYTEVYSDRNLVDFLLLLIGKSTDTQTVFGKSGFGNYTSNYTSLTGNLDNKGIFYGTDATEDTGLVKVFGMEYWWGNLCRRVAGMINDHGTLKIKMTYGQSDGTTVDGYNTTGDGYITIPNTTLIDASNGYISEMIFSMYGLIPKAIKGSATTYYTDGIRANNSQLNYLVVGGSSGYASEAGAICSGISYEPSYSHWSINASISCKPLAKV